MASPEVTILMSAYNAMPYLPEAVESMRVQTLKDFVFLIVNDGSTDDSAAYLDSLDDPRIRVIHQENQGLAAALNRGIEVCDTEYIARMDADDVAYPERLERQLAFMKKHSEVGLLGGQLTYLGTGGTGKSSSLPLEHERIFSELLLGNHAVCHATVMCRTALMKEIGGYWEKGIAEDWDMYLRMGEQSQMANLPDTVLSVRLHASSLNARNMVEMRCRIAFACERSNRRQAGLPQIEYDEFSAERGKASLWRRTCDMVDAYAMSQYRIGLADLLGQKRCRGYARLGWAATCSPKLTLQRLSRIPRKWLATRQVVKNLS